jgi:aryl sulfotransferase
MDLTHLYRRRHGIADDDQLKRRNAVSVTFDEGRNWRPSPGSLCDPSLVTDRVVYCSWMSNNLRWDRLKLREGDIVISAPPKCGITWTQRLVSLLVFDGPDLPGPLSMVSPWLDLTAAPIEEVVAALDAQDHRRFIKTHTPLDGLVLDDRVTYIGVGRDPRDAAVSMLMDRDRMRALHQAAVPSYKRLAAPPGPDFDGEPSAPEVLRGWMERPIMPTQGIASLATILHHYGTVWHRRHLPNVVMFHYADFRVDLVGELIRLAQVLGVGLGRDRAEELAEHAALGAMRARASELAPDAGRGNEPFFRAGGRREWRDLFSEADHVRYRDRADQLAPPDLLAWAHDGRQGYDPAG